MSKLYKFFIIPFCFLIFPHFSSGYALAGGEITYKHIGSDSFEVSATFIVDCSQSNFPQVVNVIATPVSCNTTSKYVQLSYSHSKDVSPLCPTACNRCSGSCTHNVGYFMEVYTGIIALGTVCDKWDLKIDRCCRTGNITTGSGFWQSQTAYIDKSVTPVNNSPVFDRIEPFSYCISTCTTVNTGGVDPDGDSLVYSFVSPLAGSTVNFNYSGSYSYDKPFSFNGFPTTSLAYNYNICRGLHLDPVTGLLQFKGMQSQVSVVAIKVEEYRNGVLVGYTIRDRAITFRSCNTNSQPTLTGLDSTSDFTLLACKGDTIDLPIYSRDLDFSDSTKIKMERSQPGAVFTTFTSGKRMHGNLYWVVPDSVSAPTDYHFIITVEDDHCPTPGRMTRDFLIHVVPELEKGYTVTLGPCGLATFKNSSSYIQNYYWAGAPSFADTGGTVYYQFNSRNKYPFQLKVATLSGCSRTFYDTVDVGTNVSFVDISLTNDTALCKGESIDLVAVASNGQAPYTYTWSDSLGNNPIVHLTPTSSVKYRLDVKDNRGCKASDSVQIILNSLPTVNAGGDFQLCANVGSKALTATPVGGTWSGAGLSGSNFDPAISGSGSFRLIYSFTNSNNCSSKDTLDVRVHPVSAAIAGSNIDICITDAPVTLSPSPVGGTWLGTGVAAGKFDPVAAGEGSRYLRYTYTDSNSCETQDSLLAKVRLNHATVDAGPVQAICGSNALVNLFGSPAGGTWTGNGITQQSGSYLFDPTAAGSGAHLLTYKYVSNGCSKQDSTYITVHDNPDAGFTATPETGKAPLQVQFTNTTTVPTDNWYWVFGNNLATSTLKNPNFTFSDTGLYTVYLYVKNTSTRCEDSIRKVNYIQVGSPVGIIQQVFAGQEVQVYPVPAEEYVVLVSGAANQQTLKLTLFNSQGKIVREMEVLANNKIIVERERLEPGLYLFSLTGSDGYRQTGKLIFR